MESCLKSAANSMQCCTVCNEQSFPRKTLAGKISQTVYVHEFRLLSKVTQPQKQIIAVTKC